MWRKFFPFAFIKHAVHHGYWATISLGVVTPELWCQGLEPWANTYKFGFLQERFPQILDDSRKEIL